MATPPEGRAGDVSIVPTVARASVVVAAIMAAFEITKEEVAPSLTKDASHVVTVIVTTLLSAVVAVYVVRQQHRAAAALRLNEEGLRITLESIGDGVITTDRAGKITRMNPVAVRLTGWPLDEARGRPLAEVFDIVNADTRIPAEDPVARVIASGEVVGLANHTMLIARGGAERAIADAGAPIWNDARALVGVVLTFRDVSEEERLRRQIEQTQRLDALGMLAGGVAHDFNNLLTAITGALDLLRMQLGDDEVAAREHVELIAEASDRAADLTRRLLAFSRKPSFVMKPIDVHEPIRSAIGLLRRSIDKRIEIVTDFAARPSRMMGDATQLQSLFLNLGVNAAHAMPDGGTLTFSTRTVDLDESACRSSPFDLKPGPHVQIDVRDTGLGIAPEMLGRIFDPFFTTREPGVGTGLGLASAYGAVKHHGGGITVSSEVGKGSLFQITLALTDSTAASAAESQVPVSGTGRILLVEDEPTVRITTAGLLRRLGYEVVVATNGREGVELFERGPGKFDLVLLDMVMPAMNGTDCFRALRRRDPHAAVVLSSGFARDADVDALLAEGALAFLRKPYTAVELSDVVTSALGRTTRAT